MKTLLTLGLWLAIALESAAAPQTKVQLLLASTAAARGDTILAGIELRMPAGWHSYWRNAGDSGQATEVRWTLPRGMTAGPLQWPVPEKLVTPPLTTYVYSNRVVLLVSLHVGAEVESGPQKIRASVSWLECGLICLPGKAVTETEFLIGQVSKLSRDATFLTEWQARLPAAGSGVMLGRPELRIQSRWEDSGTDDARPLIVEGDAAATDFYPYSNEAYELDADTTLLPCPPGKFAFRKSVRKTKTGWPDRIDGILLVPPSAAFPQRAREVLLEPSQAGRILRE